MSDLSVASPLVLVRDRWIPEDLQRKMAAFSPRSQLGKIIRECFSYLPAELAGELLERISSVCVLESSLSLVVIRADGSTEDLGLVGNKVITTAGVGFLVDAWQNLLEPEIMKYHGLGTGTTAEANGDTALVTELTTQYGTDNTRATGSLTEGASANIFRSVGTNSLDASVAITEHGIFSQAATGGGTLWDRTVFSAVNLGNGDSLQSTYDMTASAGG